MVSINKKTIQNKTYYYLEHSYREKTKIYKKTQYLGKSIPKNIQKIKEEFITQYYQEHWYTTFEAIKKAYQKQQKSIPVSIQKKQLKTFATNFTYNTNKIEGSTLTLKETALLLEKGISPNRRPIEDVKETEHHQKIFMEMLNYTKMVSQSTIEHWHQQLFFDTKPDIAGKIRTYQVEILASAYKPPYPIELQSLLLEFFDWYKKNLRTMHPVRLAALVHLKLVSIHPFGDGNGRLSRLFMNHVLNSFGYPMIIIDYATRNSYYHALEKSQIEEDESYYVEWFFKRFVKEYESLIQ